MTRLLQFVRQRPVWLLLFIIAVAAGTAYSLRSRKPLVAANSYHTVKRDDFLVSLVEGGTLRAVQELIIRNELEGGTTIVSVVPEGTTVKQGDLLVELDSSGLKEKISNQEVTVQNAEGAYGRAKEDLEIQKLTMDASVKDAALKVEFSISDLEKYKEGDWPQTLRAVEGRITIAQEEIQRAQDRLNWTKTLEAKGYATKDELKADTLTMKRQEIAVAQAEEEMRLATKYTYPKSVRQLEAAQDTARLSLLQVRQRAASTIKSYETDVTSKLNTFELQRDRLAEMKKQLELTKIYAPQEGLVVYATGSSSGSGILIEQGASIRQKQDLIKLPDVTQMMIEIRVHESHVRQVKPNLGAYVTIDSLPDKQFTGVVKKVAVLPDTSSRFYNPNMKVYTTEVWINESLSDIKPGVSGRAEIVVTNLLQVLTIPIQAVTTVKGQQVCYVRRGEQDVTVPVEVGLFNDRMIEIRKGLNEGDRVLLSALANSDTISLDGSVLNRDEDGTNRPLPKMPPVGITTSKHDKEGLPAGVRRSSGNTSTKTTSPTTPRPEKTAKPERKDKTTATESPARTKPTGP
ncbi:MAG: efflux RND transporter periplasmic adaptor subunit [Verrucomicrobia bacterium]|nr:efflux RND transporter periplasmic adaptor subunit [Verrucomicrobiota bacterium]